MCCDNCNKKSERYYQIVDDKYCEACAKQYEKSLLWRTAKVFTKAPGFGPSIELQELGIITVRPNESNKQALIREGFDPAKSRIEIIDL